MFTSKLLLDKLSKYIFHVKLYMEQHLDMDWLYGNQTYYYELIKLNNFGYFDVIILKLNVNVNV